MAEELTRSLRALSERGVPRCAAEVLESARHEAAAESAPRWVLRPAWVAVTAFAATLVVLGGSLWLVAAVRRTALDVGSGWIPEPIGDPAASVSGGWVLIPAIAAAVAIVALIVRYQQLRARKERTMATTIETSPGKQLETAKRNNRWLIVTVVILAVALVALSAWVIYDVASEPETVATADINALYDDYIGARMDADTEAFFDVTTEDYALNSFGVRIPRVEQANAIAVGGDFQLERVGDLVVMGEGPEYFVAAAEQMTLRGADYVGVSAYRVIETEEGLKIAEHSWVGNI
jgi:hypothetical protein